MLALVHLATDSIGGTRDTVAERALAWNVALGLFLTTLLLGLGRLKMSTSVCDEAAVRMIMTYGALDGLGNVVGGVPD